MAEKKQSTADAYKKMIKELQSGTVAPIYLLMGAESYYIDKVTEYITSHLIKEEEKDFNLTMLYGADISAQQVMDLCRRFPMMAERQVVIIREAQNMKDLEMLEKYAERPVKTTVLVICHMGGTIDGRKKITAKIAASGKVLVSDPPKYDRDIIAFIEEYIRREEYNATIDPRAAQVMAAYIGSDLKRLTSELDKLLLAFPNQGARKITSELIEEKIGISKQFNVFEMKDALVDKDALKAQRIAKYFNNNPKAGGLFALLPITFSYFQNLMLCYYAPKPINETAIMSQLGLKSPWAAKSYITGMRNFSARKTLAIISKIREIDAKSKGLDNVSTSPEDLLKELVTFILH